MEPKLNWELTKARFPIGSTVEGEVIHVEPYGVFVTIPECPVQAVLLVTELEDGERSFDLSEYPAIGSRVQAVVVDLVEHNHQLRRSTRRSRTKEGQQPLSGRGGDDEDEG